MMNKIKVIVVQFKIHGLDVNKNLSKIKRILKKYSEIKPDLIVFPEYSLTGPLWGNYNLAFNEKDEIWKLNKL